MADKQLTVFEYEFEVLVSESTREDGWVNGTKWCKKYGKTWYEFKRLPDTSRFTKALEKHISGNAGTIPVFKTEGKGRGSVTWIHPLLAIKLAEWLNPDFEVYVKETFERYLEADPDLAIDIVHRTKDKKSLSKIKASVDVQEKYLDGYHSLHDTIKKCGGKGYTHATVNGMNTKAINMTPVGTRNHWGNDEKIAIMFLELSQRKQIEANRSSGHWQLASTCGKVSEELQPSLIRALGVIK